MSHRPFLLRQFESWWEEREGCLPTESLRRANHKKGSAANALRCVLASLSKHSITDVAAMSGRGVSALQEQCELRGWSPQVLETARVKWQRAHTNERFPAAGRLGQLKRLLGPFMDAAPDEAIVALRMMERKFLVLGS